MVTKKTTAKKAPAATPAKKVTSAADRPRAAEPHEVVMSSNTQNAAVMSVWGKFAGDVNLQELVNDLGEQTKKVQDGDMKPIEGMLYRQAKTLETMFTNLARRAESQEHLKQFQTHLTLALKAQAQCRSTLEALAEIKNPRPVQFVKQANIAHGPQQVNNGRAPDGLTEQYAQACMQAGKNESLQNELLEDARHGSTHLDTGATAAAARSHSAVEAVAAVHRAAKRKG